MADISHFVDEAQPIARVANRWQQTLINSVVLFGITAAAYWPACGNGFVNLDDNSYVCTRPEVLNGIRWKGLLWAATAEVVGNWHPLTLISLQLDAQLFGPSPAGFHRTAVLIHAVNAALVFLMILALTGSQGKSVLVAALFALHPMRVESVAWISERKDVLSGFFFCLTILAYVYYTRLPSLGRYILVALCLALGLSAKSMLVTTPCVLLLLDYWPLDRMRNSLGIELPKLRNLILEKIPLLGLSLATSIVTIASQDFGIGTLTDFPLGSRIENAVVSCAAYMGQTCWPSGLSLYYVYHDASVSVLQFCAASGLLLALTSIAVWQRDRRPYLIVGWFWFLGMLVPVSGLIQVGNQTRADRYMYLPHIGLFLAVVWYGADLVRRSRRATVAATCLAAVFLTACGFVTVRQIAVWRNSESLWRRVYSFHPDDVHVVQTLISCLFHTGKKVDALNLTNATLRTTDATNRDMMLMLAMMLAVQGEHEACERTLEKTLKHFPNRAELYSNRGKARAAQGKWQAAADDFRRASKLSPRSVSFQFYLAHALQKTGQSEEARQILAAALRQSPQWPQMAATDAWRMSTSADPSERVPFWPVCLAEQAVEATDESSPPYLDVLAAAYADAGRFEEAIVIAKRAVQQAEDAKQTARADIIRQRLGLYEQCQPFREIRPGANPVTP